jgi:hypothetical protein
MADFSKQYCELHDPEMTHDFDILQMANQVLPEHYIPIICEGFGFVAIGKNENGEIILAYRKPNDEIEWKTYNEVIK